MKKILITTGGSGGHVIPAAILYEHLSNENEVIISTDKRGYRYLNKDIYKIEIINTPRLSNIFTLPFNLIIILFLTVKSLFFLKKQKVDYIFSTGGYMSLPLILAGKFLNLRLYLLEPNIVLGRANKFFLSSCEKIFCYTEKIKNFPENLKNKIVLIKPLVRKEFYHEIIDNKNKKWTLLVVGGSQGASFFDNNLNDIIVNLAKKFPIKIIHQTHKENISKLTNFYSKENIENLVFCYEKDFVNIIEKSDICITRAGATTLAELSILNKPFIAVPLPSSKDNHQYENANFYYNKNCCWILHQNLFKSKLELTLRGIFENKTEFLEKKENLKKLNYQNTWINVNQKILENINEN